MNSEREKMIQRAILIIMAEWGYSRERAEGWLNDEADWQESRQDNPDRFVGFPEA